MVVVIIIGGEAAADTALLELVVEQQHLQQYCGYKCRCWFSCGASRAASDGAINPADSERTAQLISTWLASLATSRQLARIPKKTRGDSGQVRGVQGIAKTH